MTSVRASLTRVASPALLLAAAVSIAAAQAPDRDARRVDERIRALRQDAQRLAAEARTLVGDLQKLEVERQLRTAEAEQAEAAHAAAERTLQDTTTRLAALDAQREAQVPDLESQLVDLYKRGPRGYAPLLFGSRNIRDFARAMRAVGALADINARRLAEHRRTLDALQEQRARLEQTTKELQARASAARQARAAAERAVAARTELAARIDARRDLTAQYVGELQGAYERLEQQVNAGPRDGETAIPLAPFRGGLEWPVAGSVRARFGQTANRLGGTAVKNGIEIAAPEGTPVHAVHGGTVGFADTYPGFGTLVIVDHGGDDFSLYGYLGAVSVSRGATVAAGAELGRVGTPPGGMPALYFEMRIDGRSVDPLQWLKAR